MEAETSGRVMPKQWPEFEKLYKTPVPKTSEAHYYISNLAQSKQYANIWSLVDSFVDLERWLVEEEKKHKNVGNYKMSTLTFIVAAIKQSNAHKRWSEFKTADMKLSIADQQRFHQKGNEWLLSVDLTSANFTTMLLFDDESELSGSWASFLEKRGVHPALIKSKHFRQMVFGSLNAKHNSKIQKMITGLIIKHIRQELKGLLPEDAFIFFSNDEFVVKCGEGEEPDESTLAIISAIYRALANPIPVFEGKSVVLGKHMKITHYTLRAINRKGHCVKTLYTPVREEGSDQVTGLARDYTQLWGVPGNRFHLYFKRHILQAPYDKRDLYFVTEGHLAMWVVDNFDELNEGEGHANEEEAGEAESPVDK